MVRQHPSNCTGILFHLEGSSGVGSGGGVKFETQGRDIYEHQAEDHPLMDIALAK